MLTKIFKTGFAVWAFFLTPLYCTHLLWVLSVHVFDKISIVVRTVITDASKFFDDALILVN